MKNIQMEFPEVGNAITKIKILKELTILRRGKSCILITNSLAKNNYER